MDATTPSTSAASSTGTSTSSTTQQTQPKIDPLRLLKCLSILLNPKGGIKGVGEVTRVKGLMTKYSKKLVSKCIYLNILQATDTPLLDLFYKEGGWELVGAWLEEAVKGRNWPLATQVLTLMESSPLTLARLKRNSTPKLVKDLSRVTQAPGVQTVAKRLVQKWMEVVRQGDCVAAAAAAGMSLAVTYAPTQTLTTPTTTPITNNTTTGNNVHATPGQVQTPTPAPAGTTGEGAEGSSSADDESSNASTESDPPPAPAATTPIRITIRSGSQVLAKVTSQRPSLESAEGDEKKKTLNSVRDETPRTGVPAPSSAIITTTSTTTTITTTATTTSTSTVASLPTTSTTTTGAVHTIVTFTGPSTTSPTPATLPTTTTTSESTTKPTANKDQPDGAEEKSSSGSEEGGSAVNGDATPLEKLAAEGKKETKRGKEKKTRERDKAKDKEKEKEEKEKEKEKEEKEKPEKEKIDKDDKKEREKRSEKRDKERSKSSSSKSSDKDKDKDRDKKKDSRSDRHRSSKDKDKDKDRRDKDRKSSSSSSSSSRKSSSKDKDRDKDKDKDKDKDRDKDKEEKKKRQESEDKATLEKVKPLSVDGLAKIPRKVAPPTFLDALGSADADLKQTRKPSSVKTYKSRGFRNTGLLEEPALPPKKPGDKKSTTAATTTATTTPAATGVKRASLDDLPATIPDKRVRSSVSSQPLNADKPGGVKLISPKRPSLSDDGGFMAALTAAGPERKKVSRKRKSSESESKDPSAPGKTENGGEEGAATSPTQPNGNKDEKPGMMSPTSVRPTFNFYQETLKSDEEKGEGEEGKEESEEKEEEGEGKEEGDEETKMDVDNAEKSDQEAMETEEGNEEGFRDEDIPIAPAVPAPAQEEYEKVEVTFSAPDPGTVRGVLVYHRAADRRRKSVKWRQEDDLQEVFYFELDETERVNVNTVKFNELMAMEKQREREMMGKGRGMNRLDMINKGIGGMHSGGRPENVSTYMRWSLLPVMLTGQPNVVVGARSQEKHTQAARQTSTMPAFYHPSTLPETPKEPDPEMVQRAEPKEIPLNDVLGQDNLHDHRDKFWPEPLLSEPPPYPPYPMGAGMPPGGGSRGGGSHWVIGGGGPPAPGYGGGPMYGSSGPMPVGPGGPGGPCGYGGPGGYGGDMGEGMDGWGGPGPDYPGQNMMMMGGGQNVMMGGHPNMAGPPRNMMGPNMGMSGGGGGPRFRGRQGGGGGGNWSNSGRPPPVCRHFMNGHCKHGKTCKYIHPSHH